MRNDGYISTDIVYRWEGNPIISIYDLDFRCSDVRNAGVALLNGETILLVTIEGLKGGKSIHKARVDHQGRFQVEKEPFIGPETVSCYGAHTSGGVLDARVTFLEGWFYITYVVFGYHGFRLALARTKDFESVELMGLVSEPDTKAGALFPARIGGRYARFERPSSGGSIWVSYSDDLKYWGGAERVLSPRGGYWDSARVGSGCPPIEVEDGWLLIYYGSKDTSSGPIYRLGAAILDKENPAKVVGRTSIPLLAPRESYERIGDVPNMVFSTGAIADEDGGLRIYYGGSDSCICIADTSIDEIIVLCLNQSKGW